MPRNKRDQNREEKRAEIVAAARSLFLKDGFEATPISRVAQAAGVSANTIYWYFKDKDEVLVAVLDVELSVRMTEYLNVIFSNLAERLLWVVNQLEEVSLLVSTVHTRLQSSTVINLWHERFHAMTEGLLRAEMQALDVTDRKVDALVKISVFAVEGLLSHDVSESDKKSICEALAMGW
jgi:AcrR family transcriptional regulator